jgi:hypothetical protein
MYAHRLWWTLLRRGEVQLDGRLPHHAGAGGPAPPPLVWDLFTMGTSMVMQFRSVRSQVNSLDFLAASEDSSPGRFFPQRLPAQVEFRGRRPSLEGSGPSARIAVLGLARVHKGPRWRANFKRGRAQVAKNECFVQVFRFCKTDSRVQWNRWSPRQDECEREKKLKKLIHVFRTMASMTDSRFPAPLERSTTKSW